MNPLLNRLYENKSSKNKHRPTSLKDQQSLQRDKVLIPKFHPKNQTDIVPDITAERQKTVILKSNVPKLPSITQK